MASGEQFSSRGSEDHTRPQEDIQPNKDIEEGIGNIKKPGLSRRDFLRMGAQAGAVAAGGSLAAGLGARLEKGKQEEEKKRREFEGLTGSIQERIAGLEEKSHEINKLMDERGNIEKGILIQSGIAPKMIAMLQANRRPDEIDWDFTAEDCFFKVGSITPFTRSVMTIDIIYRNPNPDHQVKFGPIQTTFVVTKEHFGPLTHDDINDPLSRKDYNIVKEMFRAKYGKEISD